MNAHVWNEFFVDNVGWIPVDCSVAYMQKKKKFQFLFSNVRTFKWTRYFGELEGQRVIFSYDAEIAIPTFHNTHEDILQQAAQTVARDQGYHLLEHGGHRRCRCPRLPLLV